MSSYYLTDLSERDKPWDKHRQLADRVRDLYRGTPCEGYADKIAGCAKFLTMTLSNADDGERRFKLEHTRFCRVRHCTVCQWRRSMAWIARFHKALPAIQADYPKARYLLLTLTIRNCPIEELRVTVAHINKAFQRLSQRKCFPAVGFIKAVEVTRGRDGSAHPHLHILMMVQPSYFKTPNYINQETWRSLWQSALKVSYEPWVHVQSVKAKGKDFSESLIGSLKETLKYTVKGEDLAFDADWLIGLTYQLHGSRAISLGGVFRAYLTEDEPDSEEMLKAGYEDITAETDDPKWWFGWREMEMRYKGEEKC